MPTENPFGQLIRKRRTDSGLSLRAVAEIVGISHVFLGEVERGTRNPLERKYWKKLCDAIPVLQWAELETAFVRARPIELDLSGASASHVDLGLAFARKAEGLSEADIADIMAVLKRSSKEPG